LINHGKISKNASNPIDREFANNILSMKTNQFTFEQNELIALLTKTFEAGSRYGMRSWNADINGKFTVPDNKNPNQNLEKFLKEQLNNLALR